MEPIRASLPLKEAVLMPHAPRLRFLALLGMAVFALAASGGIPAPGTLTLVLSKASYASGDTIEVTIHNGPKTGIVASDHQSDCTLVQLERLNSGTWQSERPCHLE